MPFKIPTCFLNITSTLKCDVCYLAKALNKNVLKCEGVAEVDPSAPGGGGGGKETALSSYNLEFSAKRQVEGYTRQQIDKVH